MAGCGRGPPCRPAGRVQRGRLGMGGRDLGMWTGEPDTLEVLGLLTVHSVLLGFEIGAEAGGHARLHPLSTRTHAHPFTDSTTFSFIR